MSQKSEKFLFIQGYTSEIILLRMTLGDGYIYTILVNTDINIDMSWHINYCSDMSAIKISSKVDETVWKELRELAAESHQSISGLLTDAISDYLQRRRVRPIVREHLKESIRENEALGRLLAK